MKKKAQASHVEIQAFVQSEDDILLRKILVENWEITYSDCQPFKVLDFTD